jgi:exonuclease VII large subunit
MLERVHDGARHALLLATAELSALDAAVQVLDRDATLAAGYALAVENGGTIIRSAATASALDSFQLIFADGAVAAAPMKPHQATN